MEEPIAQPPSKRGIEFGQRLGQWALETCIFEHLLPCPHKPCDEGSLISQHMECLFHSVFFLLKLSFSSLPLLSADDTPLTSWRNTSAWRLTPSSHRCVPHPLLLQRRRCSLDLWIMLSLALSLRLHFFSLSLNHAREHANRL